MAEPRSTESYVQLDFSNLAGMAQQQRQYNRQINAQKAAKRATGTAKLNDSFDKINKQVWERDNKYMSDLVNDTESWMVDQYSKYGENALYDNVELKQEFNKRLRDIKSFGEQSRSQQAMGNKQLEARSGDVDDLDYESVAAWDQWADLPSDVRAVTPMPIISDRLKTTGEAVTKYAKPQLEGLLKPYGYDGKVDDETGEFIEYEGLSLDSKRLDTLVNNYNTNENSSIYRAANREVLEDFDYEQSSPTMRDEFGNEIANPKFQEEVNRLRGEKIKEELLLQAKNAYSKSSKKKMAGYGSKDPEIEIAEVAPEDSGYVTEEIPPQFTKNVRFSGTAKDDTGKLYYKLKNPSYSYDGKVYGSKEELPEGVKIEDNEVSEIAIGSYIDAEGNVKPDDSELVETKETKVTPATREYNVTSPGKAKVINVTTYYEADGSETKRKEATAIKGQFIGNINVDGEDRAKIMDNKGQVLIVPATPDVKKAFKKEYEKIEAAEKESKAQEFKSKSESTTLKGGNVR